MLNPGKELLVVAANLDVNPQHLLNFNCLAQANQTLINSRFVAEDDICHDGICSLKCSCYGQLRHVNSEFVKTHVSDMTSALFPFLRDVSPDIAGLCKLRLDFSSITLQRITYQLRIINRSKEGDSSGARFVLMPGSLLELAFPTNPVVISASSPGSISWVYKGHNEEVAVMSYIEPKVFFLAGQWRDHVRFRFATMFLICLFINVRRFNASTPNPALITAATWGDHAATCPKFSHNVPSLLGHCQLPRPLRQSSNAFTSYKECAVPTSDLTSPDLNLTRYLVGNAVTVVRRRAKFAVAVINSVQENRILSFLPMSAATWFDRVLQARGNDVNSSSCLIDEMCTLMEKNPRNHIFYGMPVGHFVGCKHQYPDLVANASVRRALHLVIEKKNGTKDSCPLLLAVSNVPIVQGNVVVLECIYKTSDVCDWKIIARKKQRSNTVCRCFTNSIYYFRFKGNVVAKFAHARDRIFET